MAYVYRLQNAHGPGLKEKKGKTKQEIKVERALGEASAAAVAGPRTRRPVADPPVAMRPVKRPKVQAGGDSPIVLDDDGVDPPAAKKPKQVRVMHYGLVPCPVNS